MGSDLRPTPADTLIARYVLSTAGAVERDLIAAALAKGGVSLVDLHELDQSMRLFAGSGAAGYGCSAASAAIRSGSGRSSPADGRSPGSS